jgi:hypothetical protein
MGKIEDDYAGAEALAKELSADCEGCNRMIVPLRNIIADEQLRSDNLHNLAEHLMRILEPVRPSHCTDRVELR